MISTIVSVVLILTILSIGLTVSVADLRLVARRYWFLLGGLLANVVAVPAIAFGLDRLLDLPTGLATGLLLFAIAPGSPIGIKLAQIARADVPVAVGLGTLLVAASIVCTPLAAGLVLPADASRELGFLAIAKLTLPHLVLPLALGVGLRSLRPVWADRVLRPLQIVANVLFLILLVLILVRDLDILATLSPRVGGAMAAVAAAGWTLGYTLGGEPRESRLALAFGTSFRNSALAMLVATSMVERAPMTGVVAAILVTLIVNLACLLAVRRRGG
jgi:bile acid:Na+ symporter, BASS family